MVWLLGGYMWLFVHRPFEVWPALGALQIERGYMLIMLLAWLMSPRKGALPNRIHAALAFFTLVLAAAWAVSPYAGAPNITDTVENYFKVAVFYVLVVTTVRDERSLRLLVLLFLGTIGVYMAHSMLEFACGRYQWRMGISRMVGVDMTFGDPNSFATTLLYALPLTLPFWFERPRRVPRWLLLGFGCAAAYCILRTGSRAALVGLLAFCAIVLWLSVQRKAMLIVAGGFASVAGLAVLMLLPQERQNRYLSLVDSSKAPVNAQVSADGRIDGFMYGIQAWQRSPLLGHGPGTFGYATGREGGAHNVYGQTLSEVGALGALAFLSLIGCFLWNWLETRRLYRDHPGLRPADGSAPSDLSYHICRGVAINVFLMLLMGWAGHNLYRYNWQWFAAFQAIALYCVRARAESCSRASAYAMPYLVLPRVRVVRPRPS